VLHMTRLCVFSTRVLVFLRSFGLCFHFMTLLTAPLIYCSVVHCKNVWHAPCRSVILFPVSVFFLYCEFPLFVWKTNKSNVMHSMDHIKFSVMPTTSSISYRNTRSWFVDYSTKKLPYNTFILYASCTERIKCIVSFWAELFLYFGFETFCCRTKTWKSQRSNLFLVLKLECH